MGAAMAISTSWPMPAALADPVRCRRSRRALGLAHQAAHHPSFVGTSALARRFKIIDPDLRKPQPEHWERSFRIFDQLL